MPDVTTVGVLVADVIVHPVDEWPQRGRLTLVDGIELRSGGLAHTTGVTLAKLGVSTAVLGRVGDDPFGEFLLNVLREHGIEAHVLRSPNVSTSATVVVVARNGERSFLHLVGANGTLTDEDVGDALLMRTKLLHLGGYFILPELDGPRAAALLSRARRIGCGTSLDTAWDARGRWMAALAPCLPHLDILFGNREELAHVAGSEDPARIAERLRTEGAGTVAVKLGEKGAYVDGREWRGYVRAFGVDVVDTTGAGDAFCGGFLAGHLKGWDLETTTRFANAVGAMCVTAVGGATGVRSMEETARFMERTPMRGAAGVG
jgi:sugar/nucleoside kinase (ribokinase family)